ncbi:hypothetical protein TFLX_03100 [Thermoflexales bacterium]|nr:hypothetical protein TFLX_03100 [Thermoflexales bacterium]
MSASVVSCQSSLHKAETWLTNPASERLALAADLLARDQVHKYRAYYDQLQARQQLRERMQMIVTIDRAGTARSVAAQAMEARDGDQDQ